jgi:multidrug resistance efflux pump
MTLKQRKLLLIAGTLLVVITASLMLPSPHRRASGISAAVHASPSVQWVAGPGLVEPIGEELKLGSELSGRLRSVNVNEGDRIHKGQVLAILENDDYTAQVRSGDADVLAKEATLRKVVNGARLQERREALSNVRAKKAVADNARGEAERYEALGTAGVISREEMERHTREYEVAMANYQEAVEHQSLVDDKAREEDRALAESNLQLARAQLEEAHARYAKTLIKSPIDGIVMRKHHHSGESISNSSTVSDPILTIGDTKVLRVRIDVDETEVSKVRVGQKAYVTADAYGGRKFWGHVVLVADRLGRKNVRTDEPNERVDSKILETVVELDTGTELRVGLRVDGFIEVSAQ